METINLPPGFRFHPSDDELLTEYLFKKISDPKFISMVMGDVDLNKWEPRELPSKAKMKGGKEIYFFCLKDKKYPTGKRTNRATKEGYWKATGKDNPIFKFNTIRAERDLIGMKKTLVFYTGRAPKGEKTNWVMHEFRLNDNSKDEWVVCRIHVKKNPNKRNQPAGSDLSNQLSEEQIFIDSLSDPTFYYSNNPSMISNASESTETIRNNTSTIDGTNYSEMMINPPNNFIYPILPNMNHNINPIHIPNPPNLTWITNNQDYTNLGFMHQGQMMSNTMTTSMVAPNQGTNQGYANSGLIHQGKMMSNIRTTSMVAPNHGTNQGYANLGLMHRMQMMSNTTTTSMVAPNNILEFTSHLTLLDNPHGVNSR